MWITFDHGDRSRDTAHAQWPFQVKVIWSDWVTHKDGKIGMCTGHAKLNSQDIAKVKNRRSSSQDQMKVCTKTWNIFHKRYQRVEIYPSYRKSRSPERM